MFYLKQIKKVFHKAMKEDESFTPTGILAGFMSFWVLFIPVAIFLFGDL